MRTIGRYRVEDVLGRGAFASVYLGHDDELEVAVAIKLLADNWAADPEVSERFLAEARLLRRIADPRVVRVYDVGTAAADHATPQPYFVMDHVAGGTLADRIGSATPEESLHLCAEGARAVQVLHDWGVIHRDIKPGNLLVDDSRQKRRVVVSDLGTAKAMADATGITMTMGTPAYMAPEQVFSEDGFDHRADVYALGVMTYVMLTGDPPYPIRSVADLVSGAELPPPPRIAASLGLPLALDDLLASAVAVDRADRPASAAELAERLDRLRPVPDEPLADRTLVRPAITIPGAVQLGSATSPGTPDEATSKAREPTFQPRDTAIPAVASPHRIPVPMVVLTSLLLCLLTAVVTWLLVP